MANPNPTGLGELMTTGGPGRPKGSKNRKTLIWDFVASMLDECRTEIMEFVREHPEQIMPIILRGMPDKIEIDAEIVGEATGKAGFQSLPAPDKVRALANLMENYLKSQPIVEVIDVRPAEDGE